MGARPKTPNQALATLLDAHGMSRKRLAFRVNQLAKAQGLSTAYKHSSVNRWLAGEQPKDPIPQLVAAALSERIGRPVTAEEIGMTTSRGDAGRPGWLFPRDRADALDGMRAHWSEQPLEQPRTDTFTRGGYTHAVTRWLAVPTDPIEPADHPTAAEGRRRVGQHDLAELREAADQARAWDAQFGGGDWRLSSVTQCLRDRAIPLLTSSHTDTVGQQLLAITAELSRVVAWAAFDNGQSGTAQQHFIQALRLARAAGDVEAGAYVLTTMALHSILEGEPDQALDMAQGAFHHGRGHASRRVLAFAKLAEARAYGRLGDATSAAGALSRAERLLDTVHRTSDPPWMSYVTHSRLAADATEIFRDLRNPAAALRWNKQATDMAADRNPRAVGLRLAIVATACCQARDLDHALDFGHQALHALDRVSSARAGRALHRVASALSAFDDPRVHDFTRLLHHQRIPAKATLR
ncbi:sporulation associated protein [Saccharopolyspora taberi]|uniref:MFS transporter n=1 Tax=Saccharopolyspora taberi TaxID=60895 RepID=A0ABN3VGM0_9PSEU